MPPTTDRPLRIGTRGSALALTQTQMVIELLRDAAGGKLEAEPVRIQTTGDRSPDQPYEAIGPKGIFVRDIQRALDRGEIDVAVHSLKDLPAWEPDGLEIAAVPQRADPADVLVSRDGSPLEDLAEGASVGTSSQRRAALVHVLRPDVVTMPMRGNVDTRLEKVRRGDVDAAVLAGAGLERLGRADAITQRLDPERFVPSPGQGALAVEVRGDRLNGELSWIRSIQHEPSRRAVDAERAFMEVLEGGCQVPLGAWARMENGSLVLTGFVATPDGRVHVRGRGVGDEPSLLGRRLAADLLRQGAADVLERLR